MLHLHRAERADALLATLVDVLRTPPADPFAAELVAVPSRGVERWIAQQLSRTLGASEGRQDGICANVLFPSPRAVLDGALAAASGIDPDEDPWRPEHAVWPLLDIVDAHRQEPWLATLDQHLERSRGRLGTVAHVAGLFDRYAVHRPDMLLAWAAGDDTGAGADAAWQPALWRLLRERLAAPSLPERLAAACARLRDEPGVADLPERLSVFGLTRLPAARLSVLEALAAGRDVHLCLLHPSPALWDAIAQCPSAAAPPRRREDPTRALPRNRLLRTWGQDARELQVVLRTAAQAAGGHRAAQLRAGTLLGRLQAAVRDDAPEPEAPVALAPGDDSVVVHSCHGRARQVEVLKDAILRALADDPTLEPRDVIVMCPDIEAYAPLIHATFGAGEVVDDDVDGLLDDEDGRARDAGPDLRVRLADRALRQTNPVLGVLSRLLELADARLTASEVIDLADREPVRRRFGLDDDDLARLEDWVGAAGIRWGLDAGHRAPYQLDRVRQGTWAAGLDRLLAGVAMTEEDARLVAGVLPLDDVGSQDIDLAGRLAELVARLRAAVDALREPRSIAAWAQTLAELADALTATRPPDAWQRQELGRILLDVAGQAGDCAAQLTVADLRALLADRLRGRPTRANFRTGHLTMCTLVPMRAVPHRVVCLLGLDDEVFPRAGARDGDDLLLRDPRAGDQDARLEDRQLLLDALMSARDRLIVTFRGRDERSNVRRPPCVPVGELLDVIDRTARRADGRPATEQVVVEHPLQPFDARNFEPPARSFDATMLDGATALQQPREPAATSFLADRLAPWRTDVVELEDLVRFAERPIRTFLRDRLGITVGGAGDELADALPVEAGNLERWAVGDRLLHARLRGMDLAAAADAERARGTLPPGTLGEQVLSDVVHHVEQLVRCAVRSLDLEAVPEPADVRVRLDDGRVVSGTVSTLAGDTIRLVTYSQLGPKHRLAAWVRLLGLTATQPGRPLQAVTIARTRDGVCVATLGPLGGDAGAREATARRHLEALVDLFDRGMREPLPLCCKTSAAYAEAVHRGHRPERAAGEAWETGFAPFPKEDREPEHELVFGRAHPVGLLLAPPPRSDEHGPGWEELESSRFGRYARRLWDGLLAHEQIESR